MALVENAVALSDIDINDFDAVFLVGGEGPMYTFVDDATGWCATSMRRED
jgi:putative intracellular protease/amidase